MAVQVKSLKTKDKKSSAKTSTVHYVKLTKSNKKGVAEAVGGKLIEHPGHRTGDWHINIPPVGNGKGKNGELNAWAGIILFRTNNNKNWQIGTKESLANRFPNAKF